MNLTSSQKRIIEQVVASALVAIIIALAITAVLARSNSVDIDEAKDRLNEHEIRLRQLEQTLPEIRNDVKWIREYLKENK